MANARFIHDGNGIVYTPNTDLPAGSVVVQNDLVGITKRDIAAGQLGTLELTGVFDLPKATGAGTGITAGAKVYWRPAADPDPAVATTASSDGGDPPAPFPYVGKAVRTAADGDATVRVRLEQ